MTINRDANEAVRRAIEGIIRERGEIGVQVAAYLNGELVIDTWGGIADVSTGRPVDGETLFNVFSVTKAVAATAVHIQAEKGLLDYDVPIATYWPEWGCNGKETATVRDALTHHTGTPQMPDGVTPESICDWQGTVDGIARLPALFPVGEVPAYQSMSFGWILGEIVRRTDPQRRPFGRFIQEEICQPLGIRDLWVGIPDGVEQRISRLVNAEADAPLPPDDSLFARSLPNTVRLVPEVFERPDVRRACIAGVGGIFNARSEARFWALLAQRGTLDGARLLSPERVDAACVPRTGGGPDPVYFNTEMPLSEGGYWKGSDKVPFVGMVKGDRAICCPGAGASIGWADPDTGLAVAFCHNYMTRPATCEAHPCYPIAEVIRDSLGI
ncbi:MAG: EstA family serine hydrolase [Porticoccaceae bacterium]|nr:EstA family serine hydrolase [Porticoccaceae bacterium]